jgi:hypothetical protein
MRARQESIIIFRAACAAGLTVSAGIALGGLFLDLVTPLYDSDAPKVLPDALALAAKGLPVWVSVLAAFGLAGHFLLKQNNQTREIHYILASMASLYSLFVAASFLVGSGDGPLMALAGGVPISLVLGFPLGMNFRRLVVFSRPWDYHRTQPAGTSYFARFNH